MKIIKIYGILIMIGLFNQLYCQQYTGTPTYELDKKNGNDLSSYQPNGTVITNPTIYPPNYVSRAIVCELYRAPTTAPDPTLTNVDDDAITVNLPFTFCFYDSSYTSINISGNGNVNFGTPFAGFSASPFPNATIPPMIAPFWSDVDPRGFGNIFYYITPNSIIINWEDVGYYNQHTDKLNTFQLTLTDGTDPSVGIGNNVAFVYRDMEWTTGDFNGGVNGFGGTPATVGVNKGDGVTYVQLGLFDQSGVAYDGPVGNNDGVDWLDYQTFVFNTCVPPGSNNIAPIALNVVNCDTVDVCVGEQFTIDFLSPENNQITTITVIDSLADNFNVVSSTSGLNASLTGEFIGTLGTVGLNKVYFVATDDGTPAASTTVELIFNVLGVEADFSVNPENMRNYTNTPTQFTDLSQVSYSDTLQSWSWTFGDGGSSSLQNPNHSYLDSGYYPVTLTVSTAAGCSVSETKYITILPDLFPPNVITPNNDKNNDLFSISGLHFYNEVTLEIYNRWGVLVYETNDYKGKWNGTNANGEELAEGVYYYIITDDELKEDLKGTINIFR